MNDVTKMTYAGTSGVDYSVMDPQKRHAMEAASMTAHNADRLGITTLEWTRGESAYLYVDTNGVTRGTVIEGLGTKNLVADAYSKLTTLEMYYQDISQDAVAMCVNDLATLGVSPVICKMHLAAGSAEWFKNEKRWQALAYGWKMACDLAGCVYGPGETPTLRDIIHPDTFEISGAAEGVAKYRVLNPESIKSGDAIVFLTSSGIHANGVTLARDIAKKLPGGYLTPLDNGQPFGNALLQPTYIYCGFVEECLKVGIDLHYGVHITGHGWRKLMRAPQEFTYVVEKVPEPPPVFGFMQKHGPVDDKEAYGNWNMGAGFALYMPYSEIVKVVRLARKRKNGRKHPFSAMYAGCIKRGERKVIIKPKKDMTFSAETLNLR